MSEENSSGNRIDLGEDDGFLVISAAGVELQIDVYKANNMIFDHHEKAKNKPDAEYNDGLCDVIERLGYPRLSHKLATAFMRAVCGRVEQLKNGHAAPRESPASTASTGVS